MQNSGLDEAQAGIKIVGRNINNLRYADDTTQMAKSEKKLKSLLIRVKEKNEKVGLKLNIQGAFFIPLLMSASEALSVPSLRLIKLLHKSS